MEDGKCLFEASSFAPFPVAEVVSVTASWMFEAVYPVRPKTPFPERTTFQVRKDRKLQQKSQRRGR